MSKFQGPWYFELLLTLPFFLLGAAGLRKASYAYQIERAAARWPATWGQLISARADQIDVNVRYSYAVNGIRYIGERWSVFQFGRPWSAEKKSQDLLEEQRSAGRIAVFYDPAEPANSYLEVNTNYGIIGAFWSCISIFIGAAVARHAVRRSIDPNRRARQDGTRVKRTNSAGGWR